MISRQLRAFVVALLALVVTGACSGGGGAIPTSPSPTQAVASQTFVLREISGTVRPGVWSGYEVGDSSLGAGKIVVNITASEGAEYDLAILVEVPEGPNVQCDVIMAGSRGGNRSCLVFVAKFPDAGANPKVLEYGVASLEVGRSVFFKSPVAMSFEGAISFVGVKR